MRMATRSILIAAFLALAGAAAAGPLEDAEAAYQQKDYATALRLWRLLADQGWATGQVGLAILYANGQGVPQDYAEAVMWFRRAADHHGDPTAETALGRMYANGQGVPQNYAEAERWYHMAADQGDADAQMSLGFIYGGSERGMSQDYAEAAKWRRKAADQGFADAQYSLGGVYEHGYGLPRDYVQAYMWYNLAASRFSPSETEKIDAAARDRDLVAAKMTRDQIAEAERLAREWRQTK